MYHARRPYIPLCTNQSIDPPSTLSSPRAQIFIIFYSTYGHAKTLAEAIKEGVEEAGGEPVLYQVGTNGPPSAA